MQTWEVRLVDMQVPFQISTRSVPGAWLSTPSSPPYGSCNLVGAQSGC